MIWAGIMGGRKTDLVIIRGSLNDQRYIDKALRPIAVPFLRENSGMLMHGVNFLPWTACSPDMNPTEQLWDLLGRMARRNHVINNIRDLTDPFIHEWNAIPDNVGKRCVRSMRSRIIALLRRRGGHTRY